MGPARQFWVNAASTPNKTANCFILPPVNTSAGRSSYARIMRDRTNGFLRQGRVQESHATGVLVYSQEVMNGADPDRYSTGVAIDGSATLTGS
jgi:hypothetical protein